jgi:PAS domain S-box-containing protein
MTPPQPSNPHAAERRRAAEASLRKRQKHQASRPAETKPSADTTRLLHELQVHQVELEMQNGELHEARDNMETLLEKYTDLYDFSPVGYFTLGSCGKIHLVNLTGASLVGITRAKLIGHSFSQLITPDLRPDFRSFLEQIFASDAKQERDFHLLHLDQTAKVVKIRAQRSPSGPTKPRIE